MLQAGFSIRNLNPYRIPIEVCWSDRCPIIFYYYKFESFGFLAWVSQLGWTRCVGVQGAFVDIRCGCCLACCLRWLGVLLWACLLLIFLGWEGF